MQAMQSLLACEAVTARICKKLHKRNLSALSLTCKDVADAVDFTVDKIVLEGVPQ